MKGFFELKGPEKRKNYECLIVFIYFFKLTIDFGFGFLHFTVMKKRGRESLSPPLQDSKKANHMDGIQVVSPSVKDGVKKSKLSKVGHLSPADLLLNSYIFLLHLVDVRWYYVLMIMRLLFVETG